MVWGGYVRCHLPGSESPQLISWLTLILFDTLVFSGMFCIIFFIYLYKNPHERGFFCQDLTIRYPLKPSTLNDPITAAIGFSLPISSIVGMEALIHRDLIFKRSFACLFCCIYDRLRSFIFCLFALQIMNDTCKCIVGRLRPYFFAACDPVWPNMTECTLTTPMITDYKCRGDPKLVMQARLSFPSGHATFITFCMFHLILYLEQRFRWLLPFFLKLVLQLICFYIAFVTCLTRLSDYKHHIEDVFFGSLFGLFQALACHLLVTRMICIDQDEYVIEKHFQESPDRFCTLLNMLYFSNSVSPDTSIPDSTTITVPLLNKTFTLPKWRQPQSLVDALLGLNRGHLFIVQFLKVQHES
ncbi:unnamed protein product [Cyprideis torosa]|uniref:Uncharacterized protein n=1 Tax=Cyprideis torosa TaxID=163714 RepID=A0A7R8WHD1_9CRUS|nr:unnamed protein product [Cyprideis torosa]CAG0899249.1 unnamed protein product [Cyprideis torosa]